MDQMQVIESNSIAQARNQRALEIFTRNGFSVRLLGSGHSPMFILDNRSLLSCFVNGNNLHFRPFPDSGDISRSVRLTGDSYITKYEISELIGRSEHLPVYRVHLEGSPMCVVGFNHFSMKEDEMDDRFPVFALHNPLIYVNPGKAELIAKELKGQGYNVKVI
jgi:hypothetical protein